MYHDATTDLLFICASRRFEPLYDEIAEHFCTDGARRLPLSLLNRVLRGYRGLDFYSVGMRNRVLASNTESYRIMTGSSAGRAITPTHGRLFHQGHCFGGTTQEDRTETIGLSSASKVWSNRYAPIPDLLQWCRSLAAEIHNEADFNTDTNLDHLSAGQEVEAIPGVAIAADWNNETYKHAPVLRIEEPAGELREGDMLSMDLEVTPNEPDAEAVTVRIASLETEIEIDVSPSTGVKIADNEDRAASVHVGDVSWSLAAYLSAYPPALYLADFSALHGSELIRHSAVGPTLAVEDIDPIDWTAANVDIETEVGDPGGGLLSVHAFLEQHLVEAGTAVVFYDHGRGEIADFLSVSENDNETVYRLFHCKRSGGAAPGSRLGDAYDVCGQVAKSVRWIEAYDELADQVRYRGAHTQGSRFVVGDVELLVEINERARRRRARFEIVLVQPGFLVGGLTQDVQDVIAACGDHARAAGGRLKLMVSG